MTCSSPRAKAAWYCPGQSYLHYLAQGRSCSIRQEIPAENPPLQLQLLVMSFLHRENIGITIFHALQLPIWKHCSFLSSFLRFSPQNFLRAAPASSGGNLASTNVSRKPAMTLMGSLFHSALPEWVLQAMVQGELAISAAAERFSLPNFHNNSETARLFSSNSNHDRCSGEVEYCLSKGVSGVIAEFNGLTFPKQRNAQRQCCLPQIWQYFFQVTSITFLWPKIPIPFTLPSENLFFG